MTHYCFCVLCYDDHVYIEGGPLNQRPLRERRPSYASSSSEPDDMDHHHHHPHHRYQPQNGGSLVGDRSRLGGGGAAATSSSEQHHPRQQQRRMVETDVSAYTYRWSMVDVMMMVASVTDLLYLFVLFLLLLFLLLGTLLTQTFHHVCITIITNSLYD